MEKEVIYNSDLYFEHKQWRRELLFWEDELKSFKNRLNEIVNRWTDKNVLANLEHFQNQFINQAEIIDKMQHDINMHENKIVENTRNGEDLLDLNLSRKHIEFRNNMEIQRHIYGDLKKEFFRFLTKYM